MAFIDKLYVLTLCALSITFGAASSEWEVSFTADSLSTNLWANEGTLGSSADMSSLTGTVKTVSTNVADTTNALCFDSTQSTGTNSHTYFNYNMNSDVRPDLTMEVWLRRDARRNHEEWVLSNNNGNYDRAIVAQGDQNLGGMGLGVGKLYSSTVPSAEIGNWVHIVGVYTSNGDATIYRDGGDLGDGQQQTVSIYSDTGGYDYVSINGWPIGHPGIIGCFARAQLTDRALSAQEVAELYAEFDSAINHLPTTSPTTSPSTAPTDAPTGVPTKSPHKDCSVLHIDDFLTDCSQEFDGQNTKVANLESAVADLQAKLDDVVKQLEELGTYP